MLINKLHRTVIAIFAALIVVSINSCISSKENVSTLPSTKNNTYCELKKFTGSYADGKIYLNWVVNTNLSNYYFVLEKSRDCGKTFTTVKVIKGFPSPISQGLLFSYTDINLISTSRVYRLKLIQPIKNGSELLVYVDGKNLFNDYTNATINVDNNGDVASK